MTFGYFDTSVLVKNYIREKGSANAHALLRRYAFISSSITPVELMSALTKKQSTGELLAKDLPAILARVREDRAYWKLVDVGASVLSQGEELIQKTRMRTLDAIHVASLATFQEASGMRSPFITADGRQREAARQLGLEVIWVS
jgi:predicted nucleic acid-binding protein